MSTSTTASYPFFVYGTLRPGENNYQRLLADVSSLERRATLAGASMYAGPGFPYVARGGVGVVTGDLIWVSAYDQTLRRLDQLEGFRGPEEDNHYDRVLAEVVTDSGEPVAAWVYFAGNLARTDATRRIESGDWLADVFAKAAS